MTTSCIHRESGLCPDCQADYDADPRAWEEYGDHPAGVARWEALRREMDADRREPGPPADWADVPF